MFGTWGSQVRILLLRPISPKRPIPKRSIPVTWSVCAGEMVYAIPGAGRESGKLGTLDPGLPAPALRIARPSVLGRKKNLRENRSS